MRPPPIAGAVARLVAVALLAGNLWLAAPGAVPAAARSLRVVAGGSIGAALGEAAAGDTVLVEPGTFAEMLVIPDGVTLRGAGPGRSNIVQPRGTVVTIAARAERVRLRGFAIRGGTVGIAIEGGTPLIADCWVEDNDFYGVSIAEACRGELRRVLFRGNGTGVLARSGARVLIRDCTFRGERTAIKVQNAAPRIEGCTITRNQLGVLVQGVGRPRIGQRPGAANRIFRNRRANIRNETKQTIAARYNFWGDEACRFVDGFLGPVDYLPFLNMALEDSILSCP